jgi:hypothetical protein
MPLKKSFLLVFWTVTSALLSQVASAGILVIGSKQSGIDHMTRAEISAIYMGTPISMTHQFKPYDQPSYSKAYVEFSHKVLHKSPDQMAEYWASQTFKGLDSSPEQLTSMDELFSLIANYPRVIGYVDSDQVPASYLENVRIYYDTDLGSQAVLKKSDEAVLTPKPVVEEAEKRVILAKEQQPGLWAEVVDKIEKPTALARERAPGLWGEVLAPNHWDDYYQNDGVQDEIKKLGSGGDLQRRVLNATPYISYVYSEAKKMEIPAQFSLLPLMESNYDPMAVNKQGAGLWQLEHETAKDMSIPVNENYDGRKDIAVSTKAALQHLLDEFNRFHDWELAAAAYNCGSGPVKKAILNNTHDGKPTDFWAIRSQLPAITQAYVPRLIALSYLLNHAGDYGVTFPTLPMDQTIQTTPVKQALNLPDISQLSGVSVKELKKLNPGLIVGKTSKNQVYQLMLPVSAINEFRDNLKAMNEAFPRQETELKPEREDRKSIENQTDSPQAIPSTTEKKVSDENLKSLLDKIYDH